MDEASHEQDNTARLLDFLRGRDVPCPQCGYNLRDLARPLCPECRHDLLLTVGVAKPKFLWFLLAVTPCTFSGIAAGLLLIPMIIQPVSGGGYPPPQVIGLDALGWLSALGGLVLIRYRYAFLRQTTNRQRVFAATIWGMHLLAFLALVAAILLLQ